jgi:hypothetical protein
MISRKLSSEQTAPVTVTESTIGVGAFDKSCNVDSALLASLFSAFDDLRRGTNQNQIQNSGAPAPSGE